MSAVVFKNAGELDVPAAMVFGVNAKDNDGAVGFFGTGLKYAVSILLRGGQGVTIWSGKRRYDFGVEEGTFRGKTFGFVSMTEDGRAPSRLGFTTELGKTWEPWMAYRELYCNAKDEGGEAQGAHDDCAATFDGRDGETWVIVTGDVFYDVHESRGGFLLEGRTPRFVVEGKVEVYDGVSDHVFYRGIRAGSVPAGKKSMFTYNVLEKMTLSEDRRMAYSWEVTRLMTLAAAVSTDRTYIDQVLVADEDEDWAEAKFTYTDATPSQSFLKAVGKLKDTAATNLVPSAVSLFARVTHKELTPSGRAVTADEQAVVDSAIAWAKSIGFDAGEYEVRVADELGFGTLAMTYPKEKKIVLSTALLKMGRRRTCLGLIEETLHIRTGYSDLSRAFQTHLMEQIVRLGEELSGESLGEDHEVTVPVAPPRRDPDDDMPF